MRKKPELLAPAGLSAKAPRKKIVCPELLAPAGSLEKMKIAFEFGADAVYFGLPDFSLRARVNQFDEKSIREAAKYCRKIKKKFYVTLNIFAHQRHLDQLPSHLKLIKEIQPDGVIVSDPGILSMIRSKLPHQELQLSTQANATNSEAVKFWAKQGIGRVILAREVTLDEIRQIKKAVPKVELEYFVHGAMCMSYSGRCILSKWLANRSANLGDCAQPCRWKYHLDQKSKIKNQNDNAKLKNQEIQKEVIVLSVIDDQEKYRVNLEEDQHGTYLFNSQDLCLIDHINELIDAGVDSLKIEGRAKSVYYVATVVRAYRKVIDATIAKKRNKIFKKELEKAVIEQKKELEKLSNRGYTTGFLLGTDPRHLFGQADEKSNWMFVGISDQNVNSKTRSFFVHNRIRKNDQIEILTPSGNQSGTIEQIMEDDGTTLNAAHGGQGKLFTIRLSKKVKGIFLARKKAF